MVKYSYVGLSSDIHPSSDITRSCSDIQFLVIQYLSKNRIDRDSWSLLDSEISSKTLKQETNGYLLQHEKEENDQDQSYLKKNQEMNTFHLCNSIEAVVFEDESPIPPDRSVHLDSYSGILNDHQHIKASQRGLRFRDEVYKGPTEPISIDTNRIPSINTNEQISIDTTISPSIDTTASSSIDTERVSEHKEFDVCGNLRDVDTTTRSDKSGGKKRRNWEKRKMIKDGLQVSLTPHFSDCVRRSRVRSRCFSHPFAKLRALLLAEMIDKEEKSMEEAFTQES
ncbi:hypothetical protein YC2023_045075 [Brassica napus]